MWRGGVGKVHGQYMLPSGIAEWTMPTNVKPARIQRYSDAVLSLRSIKVAMNAPHSIAVRMKPLPKATVTSISGRARPCATISALKFAIGRMVVLDILSSMRRAIVGKWEKATAGARLRGRWRKGW